MSTNYRDQVDVILEEPLPGGQAPEPSHDPKPEETTMRTNTAIVRTLYEALFRGDTDTVSRLLATDLEWWFHGPPRCQHMMRFLTGECTPASAAAFRFEPRGVTAVGPARVIAEGWEGAHVYWVHVWTLKDGLITQFREYFNTWLTVKDTTRAKCLVIGWGTGGTAPVSRGTLWQSQPRDLFSRSLPGLLLAI